jgi:osmotically-inducible protein OsmY
VGDERRNWYDDPFAQATHGYVRCPAAQGPLLTQEEMRQQAHERVERGTSCWLEGQCEPGGAYKRDPEINERVRGLLAGDPRFRGTSVWLTTQAAFVTVEGCVRTRAQQRQLIALIAAQSGVRCVIDRTSVGLPIRHQPSPQR